MEISGAETNLLMLPTVKAHSDDPPFLNVGTEVSAKYRGAFCEARIKVAKKLVKCKVSYSKGQTAVVNHDMIRGSLKLNGQVEVKQPDGQYQPATVLKLMDNTTYTVVFDDGDERTLRRSSLCLKGARHFDESETLNHLPLTDPENFGTPVQVKVGRKRQRNSLGPAAADEDGAGAKKVKSLLSDFPVGKTVFLENDRRRSSWLPAVVVPAHYLEESELTSDKLCIRSFKDGRFYAVPKEDLHDFAPDKEPLLSMLEGEIQAMYLDKPSIERAMVYLDTGELPWNMDLFEKNNNVMASPDAPIQEEEEEPEGEELVAKREEFKSKLKAYYDSKGISYPEQPMLGTTQLDLHKLYVLIKDNGGMDRVTQEMKWRSISLQMGFTSEANHSTAIKTAYKKYLYSFEMFEKGKGRKDAPLRRKSSHANMASETAEESDEDGEERQASKVEEKQPAKGEEKQPSKSEEKQAPPTTAKTSKKPQKESSSKASERGSSEKFLEADKVPDEKTPPVCEEHGPAEPPKAEKRVPEMDPDDMQLESSSSNGDDSEERHIPLVVEGVEPSKTGYEEGNRVLVWYGKGKQQLTYEAKIIGVEMETDQKEYLVHYSGWNNRYDEWIEEARIAGKLNSPTSSSKSSVKPNQKIKNPTPGSNGRKAKGKDSIGTADSPQAEKKELSLPKDIAAVSTPMQAPVATSPATTPSQTFATPSASTITPSAPMATPSVPPGTSGNSGKTTKGRGSGRRRKISSSVESVDCNTDSPSVSGTTAEETPNTTPQSDCKASEAKLASNGGESKTLVKMEEGAQEGDCLGGCCSEQSEENKEEGCPYGCDPVETCSEEVTKGKNTGKSPPSAPTIDEKPTPPREVTLKVKEEVGVTIRDIEKVDEEEDEEAEEITEEEEEGKRVKQAVDDEVFNDNLEEEEDDEGDTEQERNSSSNSSIHPDPAGSSPQMSDTNSPGDSQPLTSPNKQEDHTPEETLNRSKSNSEKGISPTQPSNGKRASSTPERKRKWKHLTLEEYEERVKARREELNFSIDAASLVHLSTSERIQVIQERIRELQKRWQDLKAEVTYLDRRKRTARRKEKEG